MEHLFKLGDKLTLIYITDMANTVRHEVILQDIKGQNALFVLRGKKKPFVFDLKRESLIILPGHDLPIKVDFDFGIFSGNAAINLVGESKEQVCEVLSKAINPLTDDQKMNVLFINKDQFEKNQPQLLAEDLYA